jgi:hypothetical protein
MYTGLESVENHRFSAYAVSDMKAPEGVFTSRKVAEKLL